MQYSLSNYLHYYKSRYIDHGMKESNYDRGIIYDGESIVAVNQTSILPLN